MKISRRGLEGDELPRALSQALGRLLADVRHEPAAIDRLLHLLHGPACGGLVEALLLQIVPAELDGDQWIDWLQGGPAPEPRRLRDPAKSSKPSFSGAQRSTREKRDRARAEVDRIRRSLDRAEQELAAYEDALARANDQVRAVVVFRLLNEVASQAIGPVAMGPLWTVLRSVSPYLQRDAAFEESLGVEEKARLAARRETRGGESTEMLHLLDRLCGDPKVELNLHRVMLTVLRERYAEIEKEMAEARATGLPMSAAAKRSSRRRTSKEQRERVRERTPISDRVDVLDALANAVRDLDPDRR